MAEDSDEGPIDLNKLKEQMKGAFARYLRECDDKRARGICIDIGCESPAFKDNSVLFFGNDHCEYHARKYEVEFLAEEQQDDEQSDG